MITVNPRNRRSVRWKRYDYTSAGFYYVTLCAEGRQCIFGEIRDGAVVLNEVGHLVRSCWEEIPAHFSRVELDAWILMPNHLHGLLRLHPKDVGAQHAAPSVAPDPPPRFVNSGAFRPRLAPPRVKVEPSSLSAIVRSFKSASSLAVNRMRELAGVSIWQRNLHEHVVRDNVELERIRSYIKDNPSRWDEDLENPERMPAP
jgi:putative transposase